MGEPTPLKALLVALARKGPFTLRLRDRALWQVWDEVVGEAIAKRARPCSFRGGTLWVVCSSPAWATELQMMKQQLRKRLNRRLGSERVKDLRFFTGEVERKKAKPPPAVELTPEEVEPVLSPLQDEELRQHALGILRRIRALKKR